jgi:hypothetical protein
MLRRNLACFISLLILSSPVMAVDLEHSVSGDSNIKNLLDSDDSPSDSPYIINGEADVVKDVKPKGGDFMFNADEVAGKAPSEKRQFQDVGYTNPGTFEHQENYIEVDKSKMAKDFRKHSTGAMNLTFIKNDFSYQSNQDIINRTISTGAGSVKGGTLFLRHDSYISRSQLLNIHWALGGAVGYSQGKGFFINGERSDTTFKLWEVPIDAGIGLEIPIVGLAKLSGTAGPSLLGLVQDRSDFERGEKGKRKFQYSPGYFINAQAKINLSSFSDEMAYSLFTTSDITNMYMNLEMRYQSYSNFQDAITISGTSFGIGFTFEYL